MSIVEPQRSDNAEQSAGATETGWPYSVHPSGWFQVAWSAEIPVGGVRPLTYFGVDLVAFRDGEGVVHVLDAHCPHLGAHLGFGGTVEGCDIVCPFHGWHWSGDGTNTAIPYSTRPNRAQRLRVWPVRETDGLVLVWHHASGDPPTWEPSGLGSIVDGFDAADYCPVYPYGAEVWEGVRVRPQMVVENIVDCAHFSCVHSARSATTIDSYSADGPRFAVSHRFESRQGVRAEIRTEGLGLLIGVFVNSDGVTHVELQATTPVRDDRSDLRDSVWVHQEGGSAEPSEQAKAVIDRQHIELSRDIPIWDHLLYRQRAPLVPEEARPYRALREWAAQFYMGTSHG
jgi:phenylpropionate dioxygenase-like ring-hydroxylating dioxygenase large terminal subunit